MKKFFKAPKFKSIKQRLWNEISDVDYDVKKTFEVIFFGKFGMLCCVGIKYRYYITILKRNNSYVMRIFNQNFNPTMFFQPNNKTIFLNINPNLESMSISLEKFEGFKYEIKEDKKRFCELKIETEELIYLVYGDTKEGLMKLVKCIQNIF